MMSKLGLLLILPVTFLTLILSAASPSEALAASTSRTENFRNFLRQQLIPQFGAPEVSPSPSPQAEPTPIESHKPDCSDLSITATNNGQAPSTVTFDVQGYDNKGPIQGYYLEFGNGREQESPNSRFQQTYTEPGTYSTRAYIKDSQGNRVGGDELCQRQLYITTTPLTRQPETGTATLVSVLGLGSGGAGLLLQAIKRKR